MQHNHSPDTPCPADCPNRLANVARSQSKRCSDCGRINCPNISHLR